MENSKAAQPRNCAAPTQARDSVREQPDPPERSAKRIDPWAGARGGTRMADPESTRSAWPHPTERPSDSGSIKAAASLPIEFLVRERLRVEDPRSEFRSQLRRRRQKLGETLDSVYQDVKRLTSLAYLGDSGRLHELMMIEALMNAMSGPVPDAHGATRDSRGAMTGQVNQVGNGEAATNDTAGQENGRVSDEAERCNDCKLEVSMTNARCDDCKSTRRRSDKLKRSEKFVLQGEQGAPDEETL